jgi:hypothetical protein
MQSPRIGGFASGEGVSHSFVHFFDFLTADSGCAAILDVGLKVLSTYGHSWAFGNGESLMCALRAGVSGK